MRVKNLRFLRCIDVFMIMISRLPAAEEHLSCSSAAGRPTSIQAPLWGLSVQARASFLPRQLLDCTKRMHYASFLAGKRTPRVRLGGRSAHEASVRTARMNAGQMRVPGSPPRTMPEATAAT